MTARLYFDGDTCSVEPCQRIPEGRGLCHSHLAYFNRTGDWPTHRLYSDIPFEERFWSRTTPGENGCILWTGAKGGDGRYGMCGYEGRHRPAHVVAFLLVRGEYDQTLDLDHLCGTTLCVNAHHLEPVTHRENVLRGRSLQAANARKVECIRGHDLTDPVNVRRFGPGLRSRACRACQRERNRARRAAARGPLVCVCESPDVDGIGMCRSCLRKPAHLLRLAS